MSHKEWPSSFPEDPIRTPDQLVAALRNNPPDFFRGAAIVDMRAMISSKHINLFDYPTIGKRVDELFRESDIVNLPTELGIAVQFGYPYETHTQTETVESVPLATRTLYAPIGLEVNQVPKAMFRPSETLGLFGIDHLNRSVGIELMRYKNPLLETVDVYKITTSNMFIPPKSVAYVGHPGWNNTFQYEMAKVFKLRT